MSAVFRHDKTQLCFYVARTYEATVPVNEGRIVTLKSLLLHLQILLYYSPLTSFMNCDNVYHYFHYLYVVFDS